MDTDVRCCPALAQRFRHQCKLHWQNSGDYLCVKVDRLTKTKKQTYCNLELFRAREKAIPIQTVEIRDTVTAFAWEPKGDRFAVITSNDPALGSDLVGANIKSAISFYQLDTRKGDFVQLKSIDGKTCNRIFWSPRGRHVVFATLGSTTKFDLEFWDVDFDRESRQASAQDAPQSGAAPSGSGVTLLTTIEHYGMTHVEWDPSGRYCVAVGSTWLGTVSYFTINFLSFECLSRVEEARGRERGREHELDDTENSSTDID